MDKENQIHMEEQLNHLKEDINGRWNLRWIIKASILFNVILLILILLLSVIFQYQINELKIKLHEISPSNISSTLRP